LSKGAAFPKTIDYLCKMCNKPTKYGKNWTYNVELNTDQNIRTRDNYHTVDKAIRHKMSNVNVDIVD